MTLRLAHRSRIRLNRTSVQPQRRAGIVGAIFGATGGAAGALIGGGDSAKVGDAAISGAVGGVIGAVGDGIAGKGVRWLTSR
ncbi:hypothetical protein ABZ816_31040 [Actinosynnema sp. NPDC047251]|uniref:hypothetical protein n=1 Tax=Saccharothrix espanaensis TaxID=103731 RepID=UPI0011DD464B|nr:hypothetical protein [Saccharothrix espanaensis]